MGLLSVLKSLNTATETSTELSESLLTALNELASGTLARGSALSAPGLIIRESSLLLEAGRSAVYLHETLENLFTPWASTGFDSTSLYRMALTADQARYLCEHQNGLFYPDAEKGKLLLSRMSGRDSAFLERMLIHPIQKDDTLYGFFLFADSPVLDSLADSDRENLNGIFRLLSNLIIEERIERLARLPLLVQLWSPDSTAETKTVLESFQTEEFDLAEVDLESAITCIASEYQGVESALKTDIIKLISTFLSGQGKVLDQPGYKAVIIIPVQDTIDPQLILHQTGTSLKALLGAPAGLPPFPSTVTRFDKSRIEEVLTRITPL